MAENTKTLKTRIQLKSDTEANWRKSVLVADGGEKVSGTSFVPLLGELIVFTADTTHHFSRLKIGDGNTNVLRLPFIDAGTLNGDAFTEQQVLTYANGNLFPQPGEENKLYIDLSTSRIWCYNNMGYTQLSNFAFQLSKRTIAGVLSWNAGTPTSIRNEGGIMQVLNGSVPTLITKSYDVVVDVT